MALPFLRRKSKDPLTAVVGADVVVVDPIFPGSGTVSYRGAEWAARAVDASATYPVGAHVTVVAVEGAKLICR